jgi:hypothetical protein
MHAVQGAQFSTQAYYEVEALTRTNLASRMAPMDYNTEVFVLIPCEMWICLEKMYHEVEHNPDYSKVRLITIDHPSKCILQRLKRVSDFWITLFTDPEGYQYFVVIPENGSSDWEQVFLSEYR